jgi:hypothetical protein
MVVIKAPTPSCLKSPWPAEFRPHQFVTVSAGSRAVLVVQIGGTVEGGREQDVIRFAKLENGLVQQGQI